MFTPQGGARPLPFPLLNQVTNENTVGDAGLPVNDFVWPDDNTERTIFPMYLSLDEYVALSSAIDVGADIAYPLQTVEVTYIWMRQQRYAVNICQMIADCIQNNEATRQALRNWLASDPGAAQEIQTWIDNGTLIIGNPEIVANDNLDALFGAIRFIVDTMHDAIEEFYQDFLSSLGTRERGELIFEAIPVIETLPIDEISEYITMLQNELAQGFIDQWSTTPETGSRDRISCALFCLARSNNNTLTWEMVEDYFWQRTGFTVTNIANVIFEFIGFLVTGDWSGQEIVDISFATFAAAMRQGQKFGEETYPSLAKLTALGANNPDPDWEIVCLECELPVWCYYQDLTVDVSYITLTYTEDGIPYENEFIPTLGIRGARVGFFDETIIKLTLPSSSIVTKVTLMYNNSSSDPNTYAFYAPEGDFIYTPQNTTTGAGSASWDTNDGTIDYFLVGTDRAGLDRTAFSYLTGIQIEGSGVNPFPVNNC